MTVTDRILRCRLIEKMEEYPDYSEKLGLEDMSDYGRKAGPEDRSKITGAKGEGPKQDEAEESEGPMCCEAGGDMEPTVERRRILHEEIGVQVQGHCPG